MRVDFGMISYEGLVTDNFVFTETESLYLKSGPGNTKFYLGLAKWTDVEVIGTGVKHKNNLNMYASLFNAVELNATHYKIYDAPEIARWREAVDKKDFIFCPKMFNSITNSGSLLNKDFLLKMFFDSLRNFRNNLGPIFIQLKETKKHKDTVELFEFLKRLPKSEFQFFLELRHPEWFSNGELKKELFDNLHELGIGWVITDTPAVRDCIALDFPIPATFVRFVCDGSNPIDHFRIKQWKQKLDELSRKGLERAYFFLHIHNSSAIATFSKFAQAELQGKE